MRTCILIAALILSTAAHATERGLVIPQATPVDAPVILSAEQLAAQPVQQAPEQGAAAGAQQSAAAGAQQPADLAQPINGTHQSQSAQPAAQLPSAQEQQAAQQRAQQQAAQRQQMQQQKMQRMQQQRMQQEQMARNMPLEQKVAYKVHQVKTKIKMKLVQAIMR